MEEKKKAGRPTNYSPEFAETICDAIATSSKGITRLCHDNPDWCVNPDTVYSWLNKHKEFSDMYARAKQQQIEVIIDEILSIADDSSCDYVINDEGKLIVDHEHINRSRLRIDTRKWLAAKLVPRLYGNVTDATVGLNFQPNLNTGNSLLNMSAEVFRALANREITPEQAKALMTTLKIHGANMLVIDFEKRLTELEGTDSETKMNTLPPSEKFDSLGENNG